MRILFCDVCDESVPQADLDLGRAVRRKGRIVCHSCESAMSVESGTSGSPSGSHAPEGASATVREQASSAATPHNPAAARGAKSGHHPRAEATGRHATGVAVSLALASVALLLSAAAVGFLFQELRRESRSLALQLESQRASAESASRSFEARLEGNVQAALAELAFAEGSLGDVDRRLGEFVEAQGVVLEELRAKIGRLEDRAASVESWRRSMAQPVGDSGRAGEDAGALRAELDDLTRRLVELELQSAAEASTPEPTPPAVEEPALDPSPAWLGTVGDLTSENSSKRWQAVQALGKTRDVETAEYLIPMLKDPDIFVRMATARILGDLDATLAIPALIDTLEDPEASVREATVVSLRSITDRNFKFDPGAKQSDRTRRVRAWRDWWKKAAEDYVGRR